MADEHDKESRTEEPSEKRISDAVEKGNVPFSREAVAFGAIAGVLLCLKFVFAWSAAALTTPMANLLSKAGALEFNDRHDALVLMSQVGIVVGKALLPPLALMAGLAVIAALAQNMPQFAVERVRPKLSRLSPVAGAKKLFSRRSLFEFARSLIKMLVAVWIAAYVLRLRLADVENVIAMDPGEIPVLILDILTVMVAVLAGVSLLFAAADLIWSRVKWRRDLRMTRQEVKEEHRQQEGDPLLKMRIRTAARQRLSRRMMDHLPTATLVVANPTHYAIALRYVREEGGAPVVIAKGLDYLALRIRERAEELAIPVVENKPLAHSLYDSVEIDEEIPAVLYKAVAEIIHFLQARNLYPGTTPAAKRQSGISLHH